MSPVSEILKRNKYYILVVLVIVIVFVYSHINGYVFFNGTETERWDDPDSRENLHK